MTKFRYKICPVCTSDSLVEHKYKNGCGDSIWFSCGILLCRKCGISIADPAPSQSSIDEYYEEQYRTSGSPMHIPYERLPNEDTRSISRIFIWVSRTDLDQNLRFQIELQ